MTDTPKARLRSLPATRGTTIDLRRAGRPLGGPPPALPSNELGRLAQRVRTTRLQRGWSQQQLAAEMSRRGHAWHQTTVAKTERAEREPRLTEVLALADALDLEVGLLLDRAAEPSSEGELEARQQLLALEQEQRFLRLRLEYVESDIDDLDAQRKEMRARLTALEKDLRAARKAYAAGNS